MPSIEISFCMENIVLMKKIGNGTFGEVYSGYYNKEDTLLAVKLERNSRKQQLIHEYNVYKKLETTSSMYVPIVYAYGQIKHDGHIYNAMAMELLGKSLEKLFDECDHKFSYKTVLMLADLMLTRIEFLHHKSYTHRDIKPDNFVFSTNDATNLYLIDYGCVKQYRDIRTCVHIPMRTGKSLTGTVRFCSLNAHCGTELSRRDDLEALGYILVYFLKGKLPWQSMVANNKEEKYAMIKKCKETVSIHELCEDIPEAIRHFILYVKHLEFTETPNYPYLRTLIHDEIKVNNYNFDYDFDWLVNRRKKLNNRGKQKGRQGKYGVKKSSLNVFMNGK